MPVCELQFAVALLGAAGELGGQAGFAEAGLARDKAHLPLAVDCLRQQLVHPFDLLVP